MEIPRGWDDAFARIFAASHSRGRFAWPQNAWPTASSPSRPQNCRRNTENACPGIRETIPEITETFAAARPTVFDPKPSAISPPRWYFSRFPSNVHASLAVFGFEFPPPEDFETRRSPNFFNSSRDSSREREREEVLVREMWNKSVSSSFQRTTSFIYSWAKRPGHKVDRSIHVQADQRLFFESRRCGRIICRLFRANSIFTERTNTVRDASLRWMERSMDGAFRGPA